jgi:sec-independent protein translocase protein TatC
MLILGGACAALVEVAELIVWSNDRRRARLHPDPYAGLSDEQISPIELDHTEDRGGLN